MVAEILRDRVSNRVRVSDTFKREGPMSIAVSSAQAVGTIDAKRLGLKLALDPNSNWPLDLTFDHFDLDCLCGLVVGSLTVPLA